MLQTTQNKPVAVLISDIHFTVPTLELASASLLQAQYKALQLGVPLIIAGDILDTKAIIRAECANALMRLLIVQDAPKTYIMVGNHDLCNEKGSDHALNFLHGLCTKVVDRPMDLRLGDLDVMLVPYYSDAVKLKLLLEDEDNPRTLIMHQGVQTAYMGHYQQDKTSLPKEAFKDFRVISGHYHRRQDIKCGPPRKGAVGLFSYIGNPYTLNFGESEDPEKGFQILHSDGLLEHVPTNLRKHVVFNNKPHCLINRQDLVWLKLSGSKTELDAFDKEQWGKDILGHSNYKLEKIYPEAEKLPEIVKPKKDSEVLDALIDNTGESTQDKESLKVLWRSLVND